MYKALKTLSKLIVLLAISIVIFQYIPNSINSSNGIVYSVGNLCFHYLNVLFYSSIMCLIYVSYFSKINKLVIFTFFSISLFMSYFNFTFLADEFFKNNDLYLNVFKSSVSQEFFFQYALIMLLCILFVYCLGVVFILRKKVIKYLFVLFITSFYLFFYFAHDYVVKDAYVDWSENNTSVIHKVLNNTLNLNENSIISICKDLGYKCFYIKEASDLNFHINSKNLGNNARRIHPDFEKIKKDEIAGINEIKNRIATFIESKDTQHFYHYKDLDSLRAVVFATKKVNDKVFVIVDTDVLCRGLDMYLLYITFITTLFLIIWGNLLYYLHKKHLSFSLVKQHDL